MAKNSKKQNRTGGAEDRTQQASSQASSSRSSRKQSKALDAGLRSKLLLFLGIGLLLTFIAYIPTLKADFINLDDNDYVYANEVIRSFSNLKSMISQPLQGNYHPLTVISLALNYAISENQAGSYHLVNVLLHLANTALVFFFVWQLSNRNLIISFCASLFFGVHPMHVESVAWISERKDVLYTFFYLLGLMAYVRYVDRRDTKSLVLCFLAFACSIASKPAAIVFPATLFTLDFYRERDWSTKLILEKLPFFAVSLIMALLTLQAQSAGGATDTSNAFGLEQRFFFGFYSFMMYVAKVFAPVNLAIFYPLPTMHTSLPVFYYVAPLAVLGLFAGSYVAFRKAAREKIYLFGLGFFFINLVLVLQWKVIGSTIMAERYTYVPYIGLFIIIGWVLNKYFAAKQHLALGLISAVGVVFCALSYVHAGVFQNSVTLWENAIANQPSERAYTSRASSFRTEGKLDSALAYYDKGLALFENDQWALCNRANIYFDKHQDSLALLDYSRALAIVPNFVPAYTNRGALYVRAGKYDLAIADLNKAIELKPTDRSPYLYRAICYFNSGRHAQAIPDYEFVLRGTPNDIDSRFSLGVCYKVGGQYEKAISCFSESFVKRPNALTLQMRSECSAALGRIDAARADAQGAMKAGARLSPEYLAKLGL